jgi:hypothetical protein
MRRLILITALVASTAAVADPKVQSCQKAFTAEAELTPWCNEPSTLTKLDRICYDLAAA